MVCKLKFVNLTFDLTPSPLVPPFLDVDPKYDEIQRVKGGSTLILQCTMAGVPTPTARWFHGDTPIEQSADVLIETGATYSTLTISRVGLSAAGIYRVDVENEVGKDSIDFQVDVTGRRYKIPDYPES